MSAVADGAAPPMETPGVNPWVTAGVVMLGLIMSIIDSSIVNVSLPHMMGTLGADVSEISWVVTGYILANVIVIPLTAWLGSLFGRSRLYGQAVVVFTVASALCGMAPNLTFLVVARVIQGLAAGVMMPAGQSILYESFPPEKRGMSMAFFGLGIMVGPAIGPTLGGYITDNFGWRWIFYINLPIGILAAILIPLFIRDPSYLRRRTSGGDLLGVLMLAVGIGLAQYILEKGEDAGWFDANWVVMGTVVSALLIVGFVIWELGHHDPAVDLRVFQDPTFRAATLVNTGVGVGLMGGMFVLPLFLQQLLGLDATQSGLVLLPGALSTAAVMPIAGRLSGKADSRLLIGTGMLIFAAGMYLMSRLDARAGFGDLLLPQICRGVGMGLVWVPLSTVSISSMPQERIGQATGLFSLMRQLGGSMGIAWLASLLQHARIAHASVLAGDVDPYSDVAQQQLQGVTGAMVARGYTPEQAQGIASMWMYGRVQHAAVELAFRDLFLTIVIVFLISMTLLVTMKPAKRPAGGGGAAVVHAE